MWYVLLESVELHGIDGRCSPLWPKTWQVQLTLLVLWWGTNLKKPGRKSPQSHVKTSAYRNDAKGVPQAHKNILSHGCKLTLKCNFPYNSHSFWLKRHLLLQIPDYKKTEVSDRTSQEKSHWEITLRNSGLGFLWCHRICLGIWMVTSILVCSAQIQRIHFSSEKKQNWWKKWKTFSSNYWSKLSQHSVTEAHFSAHSTLFLIGTFSLSRFFAAKGSSFHSVWCYVLRDGRPGPKDFTFDCVAAHVWTTFGGHLCITCHEELVTGDMVQLRCDGEFVPQAKWHRSLQNLVSTPTKTWLFVALRFCLPLLLVG